MKNKSGTIKVSALVSVYRSENFLRGCIEDLLAQTLYKRGELEIVLVNSGSTEEDHKVIEEYKNKHDNIVYIRTKETESIYKAWNRAILASSGEYLSNANTDDRHKNDFFEITTSYLDENYNIDLVYVNSFKTTIPNDSFESKSEKPLMKWSDYDKDLLLFGCFLGPHPVWRRSVHNKIGLFDDNLNIVGDYEMWLRMSGDSQIIHLDQNLGLYYYSKTSAEHRDNSETGRENNLVQQYYITRYVDSNSEVERLITKQKEIHGKLKNDNYYNNAYNLLDFRRNELVLEGKMKDKINMLPFEGVVNYFLTADFDDFYFAPGYFYNIMEYVTRKFNINGKNILNYIKSYKFDRDNKNKILKEIQKFFNELKDNQDMESKKQSSKYDLQIDKAIELLEAHDYDAARKVLKEVLAEDNGNIDAKNNLSVVEAMDGNLAASAMLINEVLQIDPKNKLAVHNLNHLDNMVDQELGGEKLQIAEQLIEANELDKAEEVLKSILAKEPENINALNDLAVVETMNGNYRSGIEHIKKILDIDPKNNVAIDNLNSIEEMVNDELSQIREQLKELKDE